MAKFKYILYPGKVQSTNDRQVHYISPAQLAELYNVPLKECMIYSPHISEARTKKLVKLRPRQDGDYSLP